MLIGFSSLLSWLGSIVIIVIKIFNNKVDVPTKLTQINDFIISLLMLWLLISIFLNVKPLSQI